MSVIRDWNTENIKIVRNGVQTMVLPEGTVLWRADQSDKEESKKCEDTGKVGLYFSQTCFIPLGMIVEYQKPLYLKKYVLNNNLSLYQGKYSFRNLHPNTFWKSYADYLNKVKPNFANDPPGCTNHIDYGANPFLRGSNQKFVLLFEDKTPLDNEVFICEEDLLHVRKDSSQTIACIDPSSVTFLFDLLYYLPYELGQRVKKCIIDNPMENLQKISKLKSRIGKKLVNISKLNSQITENLEEISRTVENEFTSAFCTPGYTSMRT